MQDESGTSIAAQDDGTFRLARGATYTARAVKGGFESATKRFTLTDDAAQTVALTMVRASNRISFKVLDAAGSAVSSAQVKVADTQGESVDALPSSALQFALTEGDYTYEASAPGYTTVTGSFGVALDSYTITVALEAVPAKVAFDVTDASTGAGLADAAVKVSQAGRTRAIEQSSPGAYLLEPGDYEYTVFAEGYTVATGSFTVVGDTTISVALNPQAQGAGFAGGSGTEEDPYLIATEEQLRSLAAQTAVVRMSSTSASTNKKETLGATTSW